MTDLQKHIDAIITHETRDLIRQAELLEKQASALREKATQKQDVRRQELINEYNGGKSLWKVVRQQGHSGSYPHLMPNYIEGIALASTAEEARSATLSNFKWHYLKPVREMIVPL